MDIESQKHSPMKIIILLVILFVLGTLAFFVMDFRNTKIKLDKEEMKVVFEQSFDEGDLDSAIGLADDFIKKYPSDIAGYLKLANTYLQRGTVEFNEEENADKAIKILNEAIKINPNVSEIYRVLGYAYEIKQDYKTSIANYNKAVDLDPNNHIALNARGHAYDLYGDYESAEVDYKAALAIEPSFDLALLNLATTYINTDREKEFDVESLLTQAIAVSKNKRIKAEALQIFSSFEYGRENFEKSLDLARQAIDNDETLPSAWVSYAMAQISLMSDIESDREYAEAIDETIEAIDAALQINQYHTMAYITQAVLAAFLEDMALEKELYQDALDVVDLDITLGANEKAEAKEFLIEALKEMDDIVASETLIMNDDEAVSLSVLLQVFDIKKAEAKSYKVKVGKKTVYVRTSHGAAYAKKKAAKALSSGKLRSGCRNVSYKPFVSRPSTPPTSKPPTTTTTTTTSTPTPRTPNNLADDQFGVICKTEPSVVDIGEKIIACAHVYNPEGEVLYSWGGDASGDDECIEYIPDQKGPINVKVTITDTATNKTATAYCPASVGDDASLLEDGGITVFLRSSITNDQCVADFMVNFAASAAYCDSVNLDTKEAIRFFDDNFKNPETSYPNTGSVLGIQYNVIAETDVEEERYLDQAEGEGSIGGTYKVNPGRYTIQCFDVNNFAVQAQVFRCLPNPDIREF